MAKETGAAAAKNSQVVSGMFNGREDAERAYQSLQERGYSKDEINVIMSEDTRDKHFPEGSAAADTELGSKAAEGAGTGAAIGGGTGAIIGALIGIGSNVVIPGIGLVAGPIAGALAGAGAGGATGGIVGALVGSGIPEEHARRYEEGVKQGGIYMGVSPRSAEDAEYFERSWSDSRGEGVYRGETAIPVVEEHLEVGKREVERGGVRVERRVTETPVEEDVRLRDERIRVERLPADYTFHGAESEAFKEAVIEFTESHEELLVNKKSRVVEEVRIGKEVEEHTETVRETLRRSEVEVEPLEPGRARGASAAGDGDAGPLPSSGRRPGDREEF